MGRALLLVTGLLTIAAAPVLHLGGQGYLDLGVVSTAMLVAVAVSVFIPWNRLPASALLVFPVLVFLAFTGLSLGQQARFAPLAGFFTLCYGFAGLTQQRRRSFLLIPASSIALVCAYGGLNVQVGVRLVVATSVWVILAEVLASFIHQKEQLAQALQRAAYNDALTGLPNRRDLNNQLTAITPGTSLVICDLDHFKRLNDTYGHSVGDQVLADFGSTVRAILRGGDYCARYGGEEFVFVLPATTGSDAEHVLARLRRHWALLHPAITFSAGTAECRADRTPAATLTAADHALYEAKAAGRNTTRRDRASQSPVIGDC